MQPYNVQDDYSDPVPPNDAWAAFLATRFSKRKELYNNFSAHEKDIVKKELRRIRYLRKDFATLVASLEKSHVLWRERAKRQCKHELPRCEVEIASASGARRQQLCRNRLILSQVQQWPTQYAELQESIAPESYIEGLGAADDGVDDDPEESNYGYNGWVMAFKKDEGGVTLNHPLCHGKFPHQKIAMQKLLYDKKQTPLKRSSDMTQIRYFHLQANNMKWVEDAIARYYSEDSSELEAQRGLYHRRLYQPPPSKAQSKTEKLLRRELWHGQERAGGDARMPPHSRQIRPRCAVMPSPPPSPNREMSEQGGTTYFQSSSERKDMVLFMPYLHWEMEKRLVRMTDVMREARQMEEEKSAFERLNKRKGTWGTVVRRARARARRIDSTASEFGEWSEQPQAWKPQSPLGLYLWKASKLFQLIDEAADWRLINQHLYTQSPLHPRRTLEQYYYWTTEDTTHRDRQQVVYRGTRMRNDPEAIARVVMVDQLWLWILDENTILTAFPRRWGRNKPDPSAVHRAIRDQLGTLDSTHITSIFDIALIVIDECSKVFFDRTKPDLRPEVVEMYGSAISNISEKKTEAYERFGRDVKRMNAQDPLQTAEELLRKSLNVKFEWSVLMEAQNVIDQLQIMQEIFTQQIIVMGDFEKALRAMSGESHDGLKVTLEKAAALIAEMKLRRDELSNLEKRQANTRSQLRELLDMKQQQAGIIEAKAAIRRADETVVQGRSIVVFTVVTIFFLPLSFFATFFGMNTVQFNSGSMELSTQLLWMFLLSSIVIIASLAVAFSAWARTAMFAVISNAFRFLSQPLRPQGTGVGHLTAASPQAIREFMLAKQKEWEVSTNGTTTGALPLHEEKGTMERTPSGLARLWRRKTA